MFIVTLDAQLHLCDLFPPIIEHLFNRKGKYYISSFLEN